MTILTLNLTLTLIHRRACSGSTPAISGAGVGWGNAGEATYTLK